jgi:3-methyl-2-oxobutanoate hydroxymethyltransferase
MFGKIRNWMIESANIMFDDSKSDIRSLPKSVRLQILIVLSFVWSTVFSLYVFSLTTFIWGWAGVVMGHIGFTPQYFKKFKVQGSLKKDRIKLMEQAIRNQEAGVFSIVLECINENTAKLITKSLKIPTIGIGASVHCDGQILVTDDMLGLSGFYPKFVKKFANLHNIIEIGVKKYKKAVLNKKFPNKKNTF